MKITSTTLDGKKVWLWYVFTHLGARLAIVVKIYLMNLQNIESNVTVGVVNVDQSPVLANRYEIWGLPSVLMFKDGQLIQRIVGVKPLTDYQNALEELMKLDSNGFEDIDQETIGSLCLTNSNSHPE